MSRHLFRLLASLLALAPVVYLLAMGPLWGLANRDRDWGESEWEWIKTAIMLYDPVVRIAERHPALDGCISAYVEQWYPKGVARCGTITRKPLAVKEIGGVSAAPGVAP